MSWPNIYNAPMQYRKTLYQEIHMRDYRFELTSEATDHLKIFQLFSSSHFCLDVFVRKDDRCVARFRSSWFLGLFLFFLAFLVKVRTFAWIIKFSIMQRSKDFSPILVSKKEDRGIFSLTVETDGSMHLEVG